jgi:hypothetical protein
MVVSIATGILLSTTAWYAGPDIPSSFVSKTASTGATQQSHAADQMSGRM